MSSLQFHQQRPHQPREKRLKVSRACFTCRVKKIKCDGVQPCMQCKARQRPCSFSKDGTIDEALQLSDVCPVKIDVSAMKDDRKPVQRRRSLSHSPGSKGTQKRLLPAVDVFQPTSEINLEQNPKEQFKLSKTFQQLEKLSTMWPGQGKEGRWLVDMKLLFNGADENAANCPASSLTAFPNLNNNLLALFFRHRHAIYPILPKTIFYRLLEHRDALITPLLLNSMYCNAAHFSLADAADAGAYFKKAQALLDASLDTPNLGLVISLCLLSTFESNRYGAGPHTGRSTARIYRDMACRMCYDLKLHKRYSFHSSGATLDDIELRKRVYWVCYCLDKVQSLVTGKPCLLSCKDIDIDFPVALGTDDNGEFEINTCFIEHIKLMQISERFLEMEIADRQRSVLRSPEIEQTVLDLDGQLLYWLQNLPQPLQWTPAGAGNNAVPPQPLSSALVTHLHLVFNFLKISVLQPIASTSLSSSPASLIIQHRCASAATNLTQLTCSMVGQLDFIHSFTLLAQAIMAAVRVHIMNCADGKVNVARNARFMFQRSMRCIRIILHHRVLDHIQEFVTTIEKALANADSGNNSSGNSSPKMHVLSPIIPRTTTSAFTTHNNAAFIPVDNYPSVDDRWPTRANNSNGLSSFGLVSPASSTASGSLEKSVVSRDEDISRSHSSLSQVSNAYNPPAVPNTSTTSEAFAGLSYSAANPTAPSVWRASTGNKNYDCASQNQEQQQMEMYSNVWARTPPNNGLQQFSSDHLDNSFINSTRQQIQQEKQEMQSFETAATSASAAIHSSSLNTNTSAIATSTEGNQISAGSELYSLWGQNKSSASPQQQANNTMLTSQPQKSAKYGLGVYASAQQHHTDVIRQHMPNLKPSNSNRPVLLNLHGQVVVAGATHDRHPIH
ncbi:fungal-specific transcription factor domain-containing protein [Parasitella parasitica]|nr:fungal-specific transcription factor domain-containing protein [Parasitella parasitica]